MNTRKLIHSLALISIVALSMSGCAPSTPAGSATQAPAYHEYSAPVAPQAAPPSSAQSGHPWPTRVPERNDPPDYTIFEDYGVNPFIDAEDDQLSTFAIDVDTGSYTIARNYLANNILPDKDSIRVEEFVNYFQHHNPFPSEAERFAIYLDGGESPFTETERYRVLRVNIQGYDVDMNDRKPASLVFVIDVSGSMDMENRLELVKDAMTTLVDALDDKDSVGIVVYGTRARTVLESTSAYEKNRIKRAIQSLHAEGVTNAEAGLKLGYREALAAFDEHGINRVILCSDGVANTGETDVNRLLEEIEDYVDQGITLTTLGFGMDNYNDVLMEQLADKGDGFYAYIDDLDEAERLFESNLISSLQIIGKDVKVQVEFNPEVVERYRLIGYENRAIADEDFRDNSVDGGEIGVGLAVTALYEVKLFPEATGKIATVDLRWLDPDTLHPSEMLESINTEELQSDFESTDIYFQRDVLVAEFAEILRESYWATPSDLRLVCEHLERISAYFEYAPEIKDLLSMVRSAMYLMHGE
jgi:Ca-activated chloride channel family protein